MASRALSTGGGVGARGRFRGRGDADAERGLGRLGLARVAHFADASVPPMQWDPPYQGDDYACAACPKHAPSAGVAEPWLPWL